MPVVEFKRDYLIKARDRSVLSSEERSDVEGRLKKIGTNIHTTDIRLEDYPHNFWKAMLDDARLSANQRATVARYLFGMVQQHLDYQSIYETDVQNPVDFGSSFATLGVKSPNCEYFLNGRWYPVIANCHFVEDEGKVARDVYLRLHLSICEMQIERSFLVYRDMFLDEFGTTIMRKVRDVLTRFGLRPVQISSAEFNLRLVKAERQSRETGALLLVGGPVLVHSASAWWVGFESRALGTAKAPRKAIVEPELEVEEDHRGYYANRVNSQEGVSRIPFVRLFCLEVKRYIYADIDDLTGYEFEVGALEQLCLPPPMLEVLNRVFDTPIDQVFGDLIRGKHGGVVILASGSPGVGKTLTAEIYAEQTERPLYVLELGELGTKASEVEERLRQVFARVTRWNAVLQFDECEIFLAKRNDDLERSAIVGIFLRLLDYYHGMLFLTSNRPDVIDDAVMSRVMLHLPYPDLPVETRAVIWKTMFKAASLTLHDHAYEQLAQRSLNGRQIRNLTRLAKILHPKGEVTCEEMECVFRFGGLNRAPDC